MRDVDTLLVSEMTQDEWIIFRMQWIDDYRKDLISECGEPDNKATADKANYQFENYCGQEGWTGRDERILMMREANAKDD